LPADPGAAGNVPLWACSPCRLRRLARLAVDLGRVHETIPAHPNRVSGLRQIGNKIVPLVVGHHELGKLGGKIAGFGNHPDAGLGPVRATHNAAEVIAADGDPGRYILLGALAPRPDPASCRSLSRSNTVSLLSSCGAPPVCFPRHTPRASCAIRSSTDERSQLSVLSMHSPGRSAMAQRPSPGLAWVRGSSTFRDHALK
jgi:hypothetical protein